MIKIRRIYDPGKTGEGYKVLVDRLWPRGISKENAGWDEWMKEISPGNDLRKWYNHDPQKWVEFKERYRRELADKEDRLNRLKQLEREHGVLTLLFSAREKEYNNATALREFLMNR